MNVVRSNKVFSARIVYRRAKAIFVTGIDTDVGKTIVTGLLGRYILDKGYRTITQKWIQTGSKDIPADIDVHLKLMKKKRQDLIGYLPYQALYSFKFASSPHLAARLEKKKISAIRIKDSFRLLAKKFDFVIVEGIGGALVPLNTKRLVIDIAKELDLPVVIVAKNRLGTINHTLLTIEAIRARHMRILGIIFNSQYKNENKIILNDNPQIIRILTAETILGNLPWLKEPNSLYNAFLPIGDKIFAQLIRKPKNG
jgi:dethiobiotin synthetase